MNWCDPPDTEVGIIYPCFGYDPEANGIPPSSDLDVSSFELGESTSPGEAYAFAVEMYSGGSITVEIWGSDANCGPGKEMLFSMPFQDVGLYCVDTVPALEHSHLLFITRRGNAGFQNFTFCPGVECKVQGPFRVTGAAGVRHVNR